MDPSTPGGADSSNAAKTVQSYNFDLFDRQQKYSSDKSQEQLSIKSNYVNNEQPSTSRNIEALSTKATPCKDVIQPEAKKRTSSVTTTETVTTPLKVCMLDNPMKDKNFAAVNTSLFTASPFEEATDSNQEPICKVDLTLDSDNSCESSLAAASSEKLTEQKKPCYCSKFFNRSNDDISNIQLVDIYIELKSFEDRQTAHNTVVDDTLELLLRKFNEMQLSYSDRCKQIQKIYDLLHGKKESTKVLKNSSDGVSEKLFESLKNVDFKTLGLDIIPLLNFTQALDVLIENFKKNIEDINELRSEKNKLEEKLEITERKLNEKPEPPPPEDNSKVKLIMNSLFNDLSHELLQHGNQISTYNVISQIAQNIKKITLMALDEPYVAGEIDIFAILPRTNQEQQYMDQE